MKQKKKETYLSKLLQDKGQDIKDNIERATAAYTPDVNSTKADLKSNPEIKEADDKRDTIKKQDVRDTIVNKVDTAEKDVQKSVPIAKEQRQIENREIENETTPVEPTTPDYLSHPDIKNTDEGMVAQKAIENKDATELTKIVDPVTQEPFVLPTYDKDGRVTALKPLVPENAELYSKPVAMALTLISVAISGISGGLFPPIDFNKLRWDEAKNKDAELQNEVIRTLNNEIDMSNQALIKTRANETSLESAESNPDLYDRNNTDAVARATAANQGNVSLEQTQMNADLQKTLTDMGIQWNRESLNLTQEQQVKLAELMYNQDVKKLADTIVTMKKEGLSNDDIAKYVSSTQGNTSLQRGLGYLNQIMGGVSNVVSAFNPAPTPSDARVKNNTFLLNSWKKR